MAELKMLAPNVKIVIVPESGILLRNKPRPTAAEINAGVDATCAIVEGMVFNPTDSERSESKSMCDVASVTNFTTDNYEGNFNVFLSDLVDVNAQYQQVAALFDQPGYRFYLCRRVGYGSALPAATTQEWDIALFENDLTPEERSDDEDYQLVVPLLPQGDMNLGFALTA